MKTVNHIILNYQLIRLIIPVILLCSLAEAAYAQGLPPSKYSPLRDPLDSWSFTDTNNWTSDAGYAPVSFVNINSMLFGDGTSLVMNTNVPAWLQYNVHENDGTTNLTVDQGSVTFWFAPDWSGTNDPNGGLGPQEYGRLLEVGGYTPDSSYGWWSIYVDDVGANIYFSSQTNDSSSNCYTISAPILLTTNYWHFFALTYSSTNVSLFMDGQLLTNDVGGLAVWPGADVLANGFFVGSDSNGIYQAEGELDDLHTYNVALATNQVWWAYECNQFGYMMNPYNLIGVAVEIVSSPSIPSSPSGPPGYYDAITGQGGLQNVGSVTAITSANVWITNTVATTVRSGTNVTMNLSFTIQGGYDNTPYDVFANSVLDFSATTNAPWAWMGQGYHGNTYKLTGLPPTTCFLILGTPLDSDGDGLTDAYERLVSKTNPYKVDTSGDGISDSDEVLQGLNPLASNVGWKLDSDNDGLPDAYESQVGLNPNSAEAAPGLPAYSKNPIQ